MIEKQVKKSVLYKEMTEKERNEEFDLKRQKFLPAIDTLYLSIHLDLSNLQMPAEYPKLQYRYLTQTPLKFRYKKIHYCRRYPKNWRKPLILCAPIAHVPLHFFTVAKREMEIARFNPDAVIKSQIDYTGEDTGLIVRYRTFARGNYNLCYEDEGNYSIFVALNPKNEQTPHINLQLRSAYLWRLGVKKAVEESVERLSRLLGLYQISIAKVVSNRIDYCWHNNYVQNPETFWKMEKVADTVVTHMEDFDNHGKLIKKDPGNPYTNKEARNDYVRLGRLNSVNCCFRVYNKSREVVAMGYKGFFFATWKLTGLINNYDLFCHEYAYKARSWHQIDRARLDYYLLHGKDENNKAICRKTLEKDNLDSIRALADHLTPKVTIVHNFEFQVMRKFLSSLKFGKSIDCGPLSPIMTELSHTNMITDYLTHSVVRFCKPTKRVKVVDWPYAKFWERTRASKHKDFVLSPEDSWMVRIHTDELESDARKLRAVNSVTNYNVYNNNHDINIMADSRKLIDEMNDNDYFRYERYKKKKIELYNKKNRQGIARTFAGLIEEPATTAKPS